MNSGILPLVLLCLTLGLALGLAPPNRGRWSLVAILVGAIVGVLLPVSPGAETILLLGVWAIIVVTAVTTFLPRKWSDRLVIAAGLNGGLWAGALAATSGMERGLLVALPLALVAVAGWVITDRGYAIVFKVFASWMIAIASLSMFVSMMPTPGYQPDHME